MATTAIKLFAVHGRLDVLYVSSYSMLAPRLLN
jgi:hypothetical protein